MHQLMLSQRFPEATPLSYDQSFHLKHLRSPYYCIALLYRTWNCRLKQTLWFRQQPGKARSSFWLKFLCVCSSKVTNVLPKLTQFYLTMVSKQVGASKLWASFILFGLAYNSLCMPRLSTRWCTLQYLQKFEKITQSLRALYPVPRTSPSPWYI